MIQDKRVAHVYARDAIDFEYLHCGPGPGSLAILFFPADLHPVAFFSGISANGISAQAQVGGWVEDTVPGSLESNSLLQHLKELGAAHAVLVPAQKTLETLDKDLEPSGT